MSRSQDSVSGAAADTSRRAALEAVAEAVVLADPGDAASLDELLRRIEVLSVYTVAGSAGDAARESLSALATVVGRLIGGSSADAGADMAELVHHYEAIRRAMALSRRDDIADEAGPGIHRAAPFAQINPLAQDEGLVRDFVERATEHLETADQHLMVLERNTSDREALDAVFRTFHTIKGMAGFLGFQEIEALCHETESLLDGPRKGKGEFSAESFDVVFGAVDTMRALVLVHSGNAPSSAAAGRSEPSAVTTTPEMAEGSDDPTQAEAPADDAPAPAPRISTTVTPESIVRVDEKRLDQLLDAIGEFVIAEAMTSEAARANVEAWSALSERFARLDKITRELQEMATSLRMVPLRSTFRGMARLVRDLARKAGKHVEFTTEGDDTELDKAMVDLLTDPLIHLLRNAVDHGIEDAATRKDLGKTSVSRVVLRAYHSGGSACIDVSDNGRGLDPEKILTKARSQGMVGLTDQLSEREVLDLIFLPGLSTADEVTDVSGRGVGMDIVKGAVESLRGSVEVRSTPGEGATFTLRLPLTLAIIDGMVLRVDDERYIVPTLAIQRSVRPLPEEISGVLGKGEMISMAGGMIPLVRLDRMFGRPGAGKEPTEGIVVVVGENGGRAGLVACELLGQQQTVIKPLGEGLAETPGVCGAAVMPDGTVGLILDVPGLVRLAQSGSVEAS